MTALLVFLRAGGGEYFGGGGDFGGGGFGGGGYSGGGGGFGGGIPLPLFFLGGGGGVGGFIFFLFVIFLLFSAYRRFQSFSRPYSVASYGPTAPPLTRGASIADLQAGLNALKQKDPAFNEHIFLDRAQSTFFTLQKAWMERNLEPARVYLSEAIYRRWKMQVAEMVAQHKRNVLENLVIGGIHIVKVESDSNFDTITVRIDASAADYDVDDRSGKIVFGSKANRPFTEYWTFIRSAAARTKAGEGPEITQCPNCGAPLNINESGVCQYCKVTVTTGQFGWVLDSITQASEWQG